MKKNININLQKLADLPFYTEGPAVDKAQNYFCTTLSGGTILKIDANGKINEWAYTECPNGQIILPEGDHLVCDSKLGVVKRFDANGRFIKNESEKVCNGVEVFVPNDLITDSKGNLYFTDSIRYKGKVCFIDHHGEEAILTDNMDYPNGLLLSKDETYLLVAESYQNRIVKINLSSAGISFGQNEIFAKLPCHISGMEADNLPDGMAMDSRGNIGVAHYGMQAVELLSPAGDLLNSIDTNMPLTSNLIFLDDQTLLVTGGYGEPGPGALFKIFL